MPPHTPSSTSPMLRSEYFGLLPSPPSLCRMWPEWGVNVPNPTPSPPCVCCLPGLNYLSHITLRLFISISNCPIGCWQQLEALEVGVACWLNLQHHRLCGEKRLMSLLLDALKSTRWRWESGLNGSEDTERGVGTKSFLWQDTVWARADVLGERHSR